MCAMCANVRKISNDVRKCAKMCGMCGNVRKCAEVHTKFLCARSAHKNFGHVRSFKKFVHAHTPHIEFQTLACVEEERNRNRARIEGYRLKKIVTYFLV